MRIDVAIPVAGRWHEARPCLDAVLHRTNRDGLRVHVVDVSADPFIEAELDRYVSSHRRTIHVHRKAPKASGVERVNACLELLQSEIGVVLSPEVVVSPGWLERLQRSMEAHREVGVLTPLTHAGRAVALPMLPGTDLSRMGELSADHAAGEIVTGVAPEPHGFAIRRELLLRVGCLDILYPCLQDALDDLARRATEAGFECAAAADVYLYCRRPAGPDGNLSPDERSRSLERYFELWGDFGHPADAARLIEPVASRLRGIPQAARILFDRPYDGPLRAGDRLNILFILPTLNPYGGVISVVNLCNELSMRDHRCTVVSLSECENHPHALYAEPEWVPDRDDIPKRYAGDYDLVIATSWETVRYAKAIADAAPRAHSMYFIQDLEDQFYSDTDPRRAAVLETYPLIETKFAKTAYLCEAMASRGWPTHRIRPGMNLDLFYPHAAGSGADFTVLGMVRWGHLHRGFDLVLEVLEAVTKARPAVKVVLFGSDDLPREEVPFEFEDAGRVPPDQLPELYSRANVFLELSRHHGFGRTGVEAMACGAACVLSDSGGLGEYAVDGENALLVPVDDVGAATDAVLRLIDDGILRDHLVANGFATVSRYEEAFAANDFLGLVYRAHPAFHAWKEPVPAHA